MDTACLNGNNFFFILTTRGEYLKTKFEDDFEDIKKWDIGDFLFSDVISNSGFLWFKVASIWHKKKVNQLKISRDSETLGFYDVHNLNLQNGLTIFLIKFGGVSKPESYEKL